MKSYENITIIANPAAQNGNGLALAEEVRRRLALLVGEDRLSFHPTRHANHATVLSEHLGQVSDVLLVVGGDGLVHEAVNGLMRLRPEDRPVFGLIPAGSGNDYAASLGLSTKIDQAVAQLMQGRLVSADIGCCNGEFFAETLSFGLDAAIALDTIERRKKTGHKGTRLYLESGIDQLLHHLDTHEFTLDYVDEEGEAHHKEGSSHIFAVQQGPTYGGGFKVCPKAELDDGLLDICIAHAPLSVPKATAIFLMAKDGHHTGAKCIESFHAQSLQVSFAQIPPTQIDGEPFPAQRYEVSLAPRALRVLTGK